VRVNSGLDIEVPEVTIDLMEKDKYRSVVTVGMLACSMLLLSALFAGCSRPNVNSSPLMAAHAETTACYHRIASDSSLFRWWLKPAPPAADSWRARYPLDTTILVLPDTVRSSKNQIHNYDVLFSVSCNHPSWTVHYTHHCQDGVNFSWSHPLPPGQGKNTGTPNAMPCPTPEQCPRCHNPVLVVADWVQCDSCPKTWSPPWLPWP
jgi:hypothetical protein